VLLAARELVITERNVWPDKDIVADSQSIPKLHAILDRHTVTNDNIIFDETMGAYVAVDANARTRQCHDKLPQIGPRADLRSLHVSQWMNEWLSARTHVEAPK
jgi:hypothetical protein